MLQLLWCIAHICIVTICLVQISFVVQGTIYVDRPYVSPLVFGVFGLTYVFDRQRWLRNVRQSSHLFPRSHDPTPYHHSPDLIGIHDGGRAMEMAMEREIQVVKM